MMRDSSKVTIESSDDLFKVGINHADFDLLFDLFRIALCPYIGKELSP